MIASNNIIFTIAQFVIVLGLLLFVHEFGHFLVSRLFHIEVEEFGFGFPPRMAKLFTLGGTDFTLNWIPFGAFVRPKGENDPAVPGGMSAARPVARLAVLLGGPAMNILVGLLLFIFMFMRLGAPDTKSVEIVDVSKDSPASQAGMLPGDLISSVNGASITSTDQLHEVITTNSGKQVAIVLTRAGKDISVSLTPRVNPPTGQGPTGITMGNPYRPVSLLQAIPAAGSTAFDQARELFLLPVKLAQGTATSSETRVVGPIGMFDIYSQAVQLDSQASSAPIQQPAINVLWFVGTIAVALGLTNLLPIPALDGGRILFLLPELLFRRRIPAQYENFVNVVGFMALILLMSYITFQDFAHPILLP